MTPDDTFTCPQCGDRLGDLALGDKRCHNCGAALADNTSAAPAETPRHNEHVAEFDRLPTGSAAPTPPDASWPEAQIRRSDHGETLAVLALLAPLVVQGVLLACRIDSLGWVLTLSWGAVALTAVLLAVDAVFLGATDLKGVPRGSPGGLFFAIIIIWIVGYPMAFFRRRHFGRPNLGPLALLVAVFFIGAPFLQNFARFGIFTGDVVPTCTSREVVGLVDDIIRKSPMGPSVLSISGHREISHDAAKQTRIGECLIKTQTETIAATYRVRMLDRQAGTFQVEIDAILPSCTDPEVIGLVEQLLRAGANGQLLKSVVGHEETSYDRDRKIRHGRCKAIIQDPAPKQDASEVTCRYRVYWLDERTGQFQVEIEP